MDILFASGNRHKVEEIRQILGPSFRVVIPADLGFDGDIPETHETIPENSEEKARFVWEKFGLPCFADDTGLMVDALGGEPGVYSARYAGEPKSSERNIEKLLDKMKDVPDPERGARFLCVVTYIDAAGRAMRFEGRCLGRIALGITPGEGFGYDPVFIPEGYDRTMSTLSMEEKNAISHRGEAMAAFKDYLLK